MCGIFELFDLHKYHSRYSEICPDAQAHSLAVFTDSLDHKACAMKLTHRASFKIPQPRGTVMSLQMQVYEWLIPIKFKRDKVSELAKPFLKAGRQDRRHGTDFDPNASGQRGKVIEWKWNEGQEVGLEGTVKDESWYRLTSEGRVGI